MRCKLGEVLNYENSDVVDRFRHEFSLSYEESSEIFVENLRWIWLCSEAHEDRCAGKVVPNLIIDRQILYLDECWHNFILFTRHYAHFCQSHFRFFVHHNPAPTFQKLAQVTTLRHDSKATDELLSQRKKQYEYIYDKLGAEILEKWYSTLCDKYWDLPKRRRC